MRVKIDVDLFSDRCVTCPELEVKTETKQVSDFFGERIVKTHKCIHKDFCVRILKNQVMKEGRN